MSKDLEQMMERFVRQVAGDERVWEYAPWLKHSAEVVLEHIDGKREAVKETPKKQKADKVSKLLSVAVCKWNSRNGDFDTIIDTENEAEAVEVLRELFEKHPRTEYDYIRRYNWGSVVSGITKKEIEEVIA